MNSRTLVPGDRILLDYDHRGGTIPPKRVVRITHVDAEGFMYDLELIEVDGYGLLPKRIAAMMGVRFREGRRIWHHDFDINMAQRSRKI
jgi:hypothetical protein